MRALVSFRDNGNRLLSLQTPDLPHTCLTAALIQRILIKMGMWAGMLLLPQDSHWPRALAEKQGSGSELHPRSLHWPLHGTATALPSASKHAGCGRHSRREQRPGS